MNLVVWKPKHPEQSRMWQFMRFAEEKYQLSFSHYQALHQWSIEKPAAFWQTLSEFFGLFGKVPLDAVLQQEDEMIDAQWFKGVHFNFAEKLLARRDEHPAIIALNENKERREFSYKALYLQVAACAAGLRQAGIGVGDRVAAIMPNVPETIIAMLATASLGAIWSSCSPDFGPQAALDRLSQIEPKALFICDGHQYLGKKHNGAGKISELSQAIPSLTKIIVCPNIGNFLDLSTIPNALYWDNFLIKREHCDFVSLPFDQPLYILFSSGTTGKPKCIVHGAGGTLVQHLKELGLHADLCEKDNLFFYTTCGWMMWNWMVSTLAIGATLTLYEGAPTYPDASCLFQLIDAENITVFGTSAKFISAVEKANIKPGKLFSLKNLRTILSTGSPLLPKNYDFVYQEVKTDVQLSSISGGTDIISCFALGNPILPIYRGELQCVGLGMAVEIFNDKGHAVVEERGELVCTKPFPSMPVSFWNDPKQQKYHQAYFERFPGIWAHGDFAEVTKHHGVIIYGRSDAVLNPGGVRIGTAEIYRQVEKIPEIIDSVVIGQDWQDDVRVVLFVKLRDSIQLDDHLKEMICQMIHHNASPRHVPAKILQVGDIPHTMSGKTVEVAVRQAVHGQEVLNLSSLANPEALTDFKNRQELRE